MNLSRFTDSDADAIYETFLKHQVLVKSDVGTQAPPSCLTQPLSQTSIKHQVLVLGLVLLLVLGLLLLLHRLLLDRPSMDEQYRSNQMCLHLQK